MSKDEEMTKALQEFLDMPILGIPILWCVVAVTMVCFVIMIWIVLYGYRKQH